MMPARVPCIPENPLGLSWHDSALLPMLNSSTVLDYFSERSNPFYDRTCNNETIKMQRLNPDQLCNLVGLEYILLHVQEPILYVVRKQHRTSPTLTVPVADYYIIAGVVYQAPDLVSVINSRLLTTVFHLQSAFDDIFGMMRYQPSKGYSWDAKALTPASSNAKKDISEEPSSLFQRQRVDMLLMELQRRFPIPVPKVQPAETIENGQESAQTPKPDISNAAGTSDKLDEPMTTIKEEKQDPSATSPPMKPPPEKKPRMN